MQQQISALIETYFRGLYRGDTDLLRSVFHPQALLFGEVRGQRYQNSVEGFLAVVAGRQSPQQRGEEFRMQVIDVRETGSIACANLRVPMLGFDYFDYVALLHDGNRWQIVNKLFTHVEP